MPLNANRTSNDFTFKHSDQVDEYGQATGNSATVKSNFDSRTIDNLTDTNNIKDTLRSILDGDSGADNIGATTITDLDGATIQALLESIRNKLKDTTNGSSGADFVNATSISGLSGSTVQALLEALKSLIDTNDAGQTSALNTHKSSGDHDGRYYTETELGSTTNGDSGADKIGSTTITGVTGNTVQSQLESLNSIKENSLDITNNRLLDATGNFTGTWNGFPFAQAEPTLSAAVADLQDKYENIEETTVGPQTQAIIDIPSSVDANGQTDVVSNGNTGTNSILNGNFINTSNWAGSRATFTVANNIATVTADGTDSNGQITQTTPIVYAENKKIAIRFTARVTNSVAVDIRTWVLAAGMATQVGIIQSSPVINQFYTNTVIVTLPAGGSGNISIRAIQQYVDSATANGKVMEVKEVFAIDLTEAGLESKTASEINDMFPYWFDGTKSTLNTRLKSIGKNLFNKNNLTYNVRFLGTGETTTPTTNSIISDFIRVKGGTTYYKTPFLNDNRNYVAYYDINRNIIDNPVIEQTIIPEQDGYIKVGFYITDLDTAQIEENTTSTTYESYQISTSYYQLPLNKELKSLPSGVKDNININNVLTQNISDSVAITSGTAVNTTNYPLAKNGGQFRIALDSGGEQIGTIGTDTANGNGQLTYELNTPLIFNLETITPLIAYQNGSILIEPFYRQSLKYNSTTGNGLDFNVALLSIEKIEGEDGLEVNESNITLASNGLSATITGAVDNEGYTVYGLIRPELSTIPETTFTMTANRAAQIDNNTVGINQNSKAIIDLQDKVDILLVLNS